MCQLPKSLLPGLLWLVFVVVFGGVGGVARTRALLLTLALPAAVVATLAVWLAWTLVTRRLADASPARGTDAAGDPHGWSEFERAFWAYLDGSSDASQAAD